MKTKAVFPVQVFIRHGGAASQDHEFVEAADGTSCDEFLS